MDTSGGDDEPEVFDSVCMEGTLRDFGVKVPFAKALEYVMDMVTMLIGRIGEDEYIIEIYYDEQVNHVVERVIHKVLELCQGIGHAHWHYEPFIGAASHLECCEPLMALSNSNVVVAIMKVNFGINHGAAKVIEEFIDEGEGIAALLHDSIEHMIVDTQAESTIFLFRK
jgi:hypothetical protein